MAFGVLELTLAITPRVRVRMKEGLPGQWRIAGYMVFAGDGKRHSSRTSRSYPRKKKRDRIRSPKITPATRDQINAVRALKQQEVELRLPA